MSEGKPCYIDEYGHVHTIGSGKPNAVAFINAELAAERESWIKLGHDQAAGRFEELAREGASGADIIAELHSLSPAVPADEEIRREVLENIRTIVAEIDFVAFTDNNYVYASGCHQDNNCLEECDAAARESIVAMVKKLRALIGEEGR